MARTIAVTTAMLAKETSMGNSKFAPTLDDVSDGLVTLSPPASTSEGDWEILRERALSLSTRSVQPSRELLSTLEPELVQNSLVLQSFRWVPSELREAEKSSKPTNLVMKAFHEDEERSPIAHMMTSRFFEAPEGGSRQSPLVVVHAPGFGPWCVRGVRLTHQYRRDVWAPRLPEHGIVNVRGQPARPDVAASSIRTKTWYDWLIDVRAVLSQYDSSFHFLVPWELLDLIEPMARVFGPRVEFETIAFEQEPRVYRIASDWSPVPLQLEWRKLARGLNSLLDEGATLI